MVTLQLRQINVPPGQRVLFHNVNWSKFESILEELGEHRASRIAYDNGTLEIIGDLLKALLEELDIEFLTLGSTTFKNKQMLKGIEPDQCFYIQHEAEVRGKKRLDLTVDPPPDLALEIDVTSRTHLSTYETLGVPELWRRSDRQLQINVLQGGKYIEVQSSPTFPGFPLKELIPQYVEQSQTLGRNKTMKAFREWIREHCTRSSDS